MKKVFYVLIAGLFYMVMSEMTAKQKAEKFCNSVEIGASTDDLLEKAFKAGVRKSSTYWDESKATRRLYATFTGYYPGSDHICVIDAVNGVVTDKNANIITSLL